MSLTPIALLGGIGLKRSRGGHRLLGWGSSRRARASLAVTAQSAQSLLLQPAVLH